MSEMIAIHDNPIYCIQCGKQIEGRASFILGSWVHPQCRDAWIRVERSRVCTMPKPTKTVPRAALEALVEELESRNHQAREAMDGGRWHELETGRADGLRYAIQRLRALLDAPEGTPDAP